MKTTLIAVCVCLLAASNLVAWELIPLEKLIADSDLVLIGKLSYVMRAAPGPDSTDHGYLEGYEVVKGTVADGKGVVLAFPGQRGTAAADGKFKSSLTPQDLRFEEGMEACWFLKKAAGGDAYEARHPSCVQPYPFYDGIRKAAHQLALSKGDWQRAMKARLQPVAASLPRPDAAPPIQ